MRLQILLPVELELVLLQVPQLLELELVLQELELAQLLELVLVLLLLIRLSYKRRNRIRLQQRLTKQVFFSFHSPFFVHCITIMNKRKQKK